MKMFCKQHSSYIRGGVLFVIPQCTVDLLTKNIRWFLQPRPLFSLVIRSVSTVCVKRV